MAYPWVFAVDQLALIYSFDEGLAFSKLMVVDGAPPSLYKDKRLKPYRILIYIKSLV